MATPNEPLPPPGKVVADMYWIQTFTGTKMLSSTSAKVYVVLHGANGVDRYLFVHSLSLFMLIYFYIYFLLFFYILFMFLLFFYVNYHKVLKYLCFNTLIPRTKVCFEKVVWMVSMLS